MEAAVAFRRRQSLAVAVALTVGLLAAGCGDDGAVTPLEPELTLGTHEQLRWDPELFEPLDVDGAPLEIVLGNQGLWMVVLGIRAHDTLVEPFTLQVTLVVGGSQQGEVTAAGQKLRRESDGRDYYYDIWLLVPDPTISSFDAELNVVLEGGDGVTWTIDQNVHLTGGF